MGIDIYGISPTSKKGEYFRRGGGSWEPLAILVTRLCPKETAGCQYWLTSDGDGLADLGAGRLADALQAKINQGAVRAYIKIFNAKLKAMPNEPCRLCNGTGIRHDEPGDPKKKIPTDAEWNGGKHPRAGEVGWCNGCDGRGFNRPYSEFCSVTTKDVREFIAFLRDSGGFKIC